MHFYNGQLYILVVVKAVLDHQSYARRLLYQLPSASVELNGIGVSIDAQATVRLDYILLTQKRALARFIRYAKVSI